MTGETSLTLNTSGARAASDFGSAAGVRPALLYRLGGLFVAAGAAGAFVAHWLHPRAPHDQDSAVAFLHATAPAHLLLFGTLLVLFLGLPSLCARAASDSGLLGVAGSALVFLGVVCCDFLHCPVEFGAFTAMKEMPIDLVEKVYTATYYGGPLGFLQQFVGPPALLLGSLLFLFGTRRSRSLARWPRLFLWAFVVLFVGNFVPAFPRALAQYFVGAFYVALAGYGTGLLASRADERESA
jgi:hypothetical protein